MAKKYENDFKVMIVELLKSGRKAKEVSNEYDINEGVIRRWKREYEVKLGDFSKKREVSKEEKELKALKKELNRKDRALAETAALLVLQKKVHESPKNSPLTSTKLTIHP